MVALIRCERAPVDLRITKRGFDASIQSCHNYSLSNNWTLLKCFALKSAIKHHFVVFFCANENLISSYIIKLVDSSFIAMDHDDFYRKTYMHYYQFSYWLTQKFVTFFNIRE